MKLIEVLHFVNCKRVFTVFTLLAGMLVSGSLTGVIAQGPENRAIDQAQGAVRRQILSQEGRRDNQNARRNPTVRFNDDAQSIAKSRNEVRVRGTGTFLLGSDSRNNNSRYDDTQSNNRNNDERSRNFSYEATVNSRNRSGNVSAIRYDWNSDWSGNENNNRGGNDRRDNNRGGNDRRDNNEGGNDRRNNDRDGFNGRNRPDGRVIYSGPIMNRNSNKSMDVTERGTQDGDHIQQWSYADQPNQNWDVLDLGSGEVAIISRHSGKAITVQGGRDNNGANIIQRSWNASSQQRWRLEKLSGDYYRIVSVDNGKCLDVTERGKQDGASIQLWDYANQSNQQWRLRR
jgi:hypothetical protein